MSNQRKSVGRQILDRSTSADEILEIAEKVGDWQLAHPRDIDPYNNHPLGWVKAVFYTGLVALSRLSKSSRYFDALMQIGVENQWQPGSRIYNADDHVVCQAYLELYWQERDPAIIQPTYERFDYILKHPCHNRLLWGRKYSDHRWAWCDALFMSPPAWARLAQITGEARFLEYMHSEWRITSDYLFEPDENLFYRDSNYFGLREANGKNVFWSRGNGWVLAGLARVLEVMPDDFHGRPFYVEQYRRIAERIAVLQQPDGLWHASLLDPASFPIKETSGSGFFTYALAWGLNNGLLDREKFEPTFRRAWFALLDCVTPDGKVEYVQPIAADPHHFDIKHTDFYGVGAFLLAATEAWKFFHECKNGGQLNRKYLRDEFTVGNGAAVKAGK